MNTMARHPSDDSTDEATDVEEIDVDLEETDPRTGRFSGSGTQDFPDGVIALRSRKTNGQFYISITDVVDELDYDAGDDHLFCMYERASANTPDALRFEHITHPTKEDKNNPKTRKIIDNQTSARYILPKDELGEYGVGIDLESYDNDDPFLFEPVLVESSEEFYLVPLGHVSEVFRYDERIVSIHPESLTTQAAADIEVDIETLQEALDMVSKTLSQDTFTAAGIPIEDDPTVVSVDGQRLAIYYAPNPGQRSAFRDVLTGIYAASADVAEAIWQIHQKYASHLFSEVSEKGSQNDESPGDDSLLSSDSEAVVIPLDPPQARSPEADESGDAATSAETEETSPQSALGDHGGVERSVVVPVQPAVEALASRTHSVDQEALHEALKTITKGVTADLIREADVLDDRQSVTIPFESEREEPTAYSSVELMFVEEGALDEVARDLDVDPELREAVRQAHNKQAENLITQQSDAPMNYRRFRQDSDAVILPASGD